MNNLFEASVNRKGTACIKWDFQEMDYGRSGIVPFSIADADYKTYSPILDALVKRIQNGVLGYTDLEDEYLYNVKKWIERRHNWIIDEQWIVPTNGIVPSMSYSIEALTNPGDKIIVQPPVYDPFYSVIETTGREIIKNNLIIDNEGIYRINYEYLEEKLKSGAKMLIFCSPHNPVCRVWTEEELSRVVYLCKKYGTIIISDEIHWDLMLFGNKHVTLGKFPEILNQLIVCTSASKTFNIAGLETSNIIIPDDTLRDKYKKYLYSRYLFCPNTLGLEATKAAYKDGDSWVDAQQVHLTENAKIVLDFFKENMPEVKVTFPEGTYLMWIDMTAYGVSSDELIRRIADAGAGLNNGYHYGEQYDGFVRMNIACPKSQLRLGLDCILSAVNILKNNGRLCHV